MSSGLGVENFYKKFGENTEDLIFLAIDISSGDDEQDIVGAYEQRAGITPAFPIVLYGDGASDLAKLFGMANYGGVQWMCHPKLEFDKISSYSESAFTNASNAALNDDCVSTYISLNNEINSSTVQIFNNELILSIAAPEKVSIQLVSLNGQLVYSLNDNLSKGLNRIVMDKLGVVKGMYILNITGTSGLQYRSKVTLK